MNPLLLKAAPWLLVAALAAFGKCGYDANQREIGAMRERLRVTNDSLLLVKARGRQIDSVLKVDTVKLTRRIVSTQTLRRSRAVGSGTRALPLLLAVATRHAADVPRTGAMTDVSRADDRGEQMALTGQLTPALGADALAAFVHRDGIVRAGRRFVAVNHRFDSRGAIWQRRHGLYGADGTTGENVDLTKRAIDGERTFGGWIADGSMLCRHTGL